MENNILVSSIYILDQNCSLYYGTRPQKLFTYLSDVLPIDTEDNNILEFAIKNKKIIVTQDIEFAINILLHSNPVIFQTCNNERFYFKIKELKVLSISKESTVNKIFNTIKIKNKKSYIADSNKTLYRLDNFDIVNVNKKIKNITTIKNDDRIKIILDYIKNTNSILVTSSKHHCIKTLFELNECVFVDKEFNLNYISIEYFKFENVIYDRKRLAIRNYENTNDFLYNNLRLIRNNIDEIEKNLNFIECELLRRKELEALKTPQVSINPIPIGADTFE